jgi:hypothetical protein
MPLQATSGAASYDSFGGGVPVVPQYIEDVFSTYLYTGTGSAITVTNGINLSANGGMVWLKNRNSTDTHQITDTARGVNRQIDSTSSSPQTTLSSIITAFNTTGFTLGTDAITNTSSNTYASWTWREKSNFFDVVTYTGTGANRTISHNLGSTPGCIIVKRTDGTNSDWFVYHRSLTSAAYRIRLNSTGIETSVPTAWNSTAPTSTVFSLGTATEVNANGGTYVAYLFAHNAGGFGLTGTDNVISCGTFTTDASGTATVNLGYEPQWVLTKMTSAANGWELVDNMRGMFSNTTNGLAPNTTAAETNSVSTVLPTSTGFSFATSASVYTFIYIAIRRGPMKVPTTGASVFSPIASSASAGTQLTTDFPVDLQIATLTGAVESRRTYDRLRGVSTTTTSESTQRLSTNTSDAVVGDTTMSRYWNNTGFQMPTNNGGTSSIFWNLKRAPNFFDAVYFTGTNATNAITHNLKVVPELIICKSNSAIGDWYAMTSFGASTYLNGYVNSTTALTSRSYASNTEITTQPTSTTFTLGTGGPNAAGTTYISYLFATCAGVSKVGSYTGTGALQTVNCGFTSGARFILIKRTDATGGWYVYDSARGISSGSDPYLFLNTSAAQTTSTNYVDTDTTGFKVTAAASTTINVSGGTYLFFAIA